MRKLLLSSVAIVAMSASALAADLPRREAAVAPVGGAQGEPDETEHHARERCEHHRPRDEEKF